MKRRFCESLSTIAIAMGLSLALIESPCPLSAGDTLYGVCYSNQEMLIFDASSPTLSLITTAPLSYDGNFYRGLTSILFPGGGPLEEFNFPCIYLSLSDPSGIHSYVGVFNPQTQQLEGLVGGGYGGVTGDVGGMGVNSMALISGVLCVVGQSADIAPSVGSLCLIDPGSCYIVDFPRYVTSVSALTSIAAAPNETDMFMIGRSGGRRSHVVRFDLDALNFYDIDLTSYLPNMGEINYVAVSSDSTKVYVCIENTMAMLGGPGGLLVMNNVASTAPKDLNIHVYTGGGLLYSPTFLTINHQIPPQLYVNNLSMTGATNIYLVNPSKNYQTSLLVGPLNNNEFQEIQSTTNKVLPALPLPGTISYQSLALSSDGTRAYTIIGMGSQPGVQTITNVNNTINGPQLGNNVFFAPNIDLRWLQIVP